MEKDKLTEKLFIYQGKNTFRYGIDAVLLAHFAGGLKGRVVDLGTGTGILPLLLSTSRSISEIHGVELQVEALTYARASIRDNGLEDRIYLHQGDLMEIHHLFERETMDGVISNPPYFRKGHSLICDDLPRALARSEVAMSLEGLIQAADYLLRPKAPFYMIYRPRRLPELLSLLVKHKLEPKRLRFVHPRKGKDANLVLVEARKAGGAHCHIEPPLFVYEEDDYTEEILSIYKELSMR